MTNRAYDTRDSRREHRGREGRAHAPVRVLNKQALDAHKKQGPETMWASQERIHRRRGGECGVAYAEAYSLVNAKPGCAALTVRFLRPIR